MKQSYIFLMALLSIAICIRCVPISQQYPSNNQLIGKKQVNTDAIYEDSIKTVRLYPSLNVNDQALYPPVLPLSQPQPLILEFDELTNQFQNYILKLEHYNADWTKSALRDLEFMQDFNEVRITDYQFSFNTKVRYVHYKVNVPKVKVTGNYLVKVYREGNEADIILTKRFMVYENRVVVTPKAGFSNLPQERFKNQQIDFTINYNNYDLVNPQEAVKVLLRQNYRWDNAITQLKPLYIKEFDKTIEFTAFNGENNFKGLNEYRFFQAESVQFLGFNTAKIDVSGNIAQVYLGIDKPRDGQSYLRNRDLNGNFIVNNHETNNGATDADYMWVNFSLQSPQKSGVAYVLGAFNDWKLSEQNQMVYNAEKELYQGKVFLKQGTYNYAYALKDSNGALDEAMFEGSHQATENVYEIIVYYRAIGSRFDEIIAYKRVGVNE